MRIFLVRHGESEANVDPDTFSTEPDYAVNLTETGKKDTESTGQYIADYYTKHDEQGKCLGVWNSTFERARQTSDIIFNKLAFSDAGLTFSPRREDERLREINFGTWTGKNRQQIEAEDPDLYALHMREASKKQGRFYAKYSAAGESQADVMQRVKDLFSAIYREREEHDTRDFVIVTHGKTMNLFVAAWMGYPVEWVNDEANPANSSVRMLESVNGGKCMDRGYVFIPGEEKEHAEEAAKLRAAAEANLEKNKKRSEAYR